MNRSAALAVTLALLALASGCQCCPTAECYYQKIDCIADSELELDWLYFPELDVSRIGKPDWCRCPVNRLLCCCACRPECCYVPAWGPSILTPCPEIPRIPVPCVVPPAPLPPPVPACGMQWSCPPPCIPVGDEPAPMPEPAKKPAEDGDERPLPAV